MDNGITNIENFAPPNKFWSLNDIDLSSIQIALNEEYDFDNIFFKNYRTSNKRSSKRYYKYKRSPIISYGIILFTDKNDPKFLLAQRRDTIEYVDFIKGNRYYIPLEDYAINMTEEERERILNYEFDDLWNDLWINKESKYYKQDYEESKKDFELIK